jgi:hypothetical protein
VSLLVESLMLAVQAQQELVSLLVLVLVVQELLLLLEL